MESRRVVEWVVLRVYRKMVWLAGCFHITEGERNRTEVWNPVMVMHGDTVKIKRTEGEGCRLVDEGLSSLVCQEYDRTYVFAATKDDTGDFV